MRVERAPLSQGLLLSLVQRTKIFRYLFWGLWFGVVPLVLAWATVELLKSDVMGPSLFQHIRWYIYDQWVPALIVFFTIYEMVLYHWRVHLPLAQHTGLGGRPDVPADARQDYEQALHLLEEAGRLQRRNRRAIERHVPSKSRQELDTALADLRDELDREPFDMDGFVGAYERAARMVARHLGRWRKSEVREYAESIIVAVVVALMLRAFVVEAFKIPSGSMLPTLQIQDHIFVNKLVYGPTLPFLGESRLYSRLPPKRGDVMVFEYPGDRSQDFIKRTIALEGDELVVRAGHPFINGWLVPYCYVGELVFSEGGDRLAQRGQLFIEYLGDYSYLTLFEEDRLSAAGADQKPISPGTLFDNPSVGRRPAPHHVEGFPHLDQGPYHVAPGEVWVLGDNRNNSSDSRAWNHNRGGGVPYPLIKGRAMFVWLSFGTSGGLNVGRLFHNVMGTPALPSEQATPELLEGINACLAKRPSVTLPPQPGR